MTDVPGEYPKQELLPQEVRPDLGHRRRRRWLVAAGLVAVVGIVAAVVLVLTRDDDSGRAAYCDGLAEVTVDGDLAAALEQADASTLATVEQLAAGAPDAVEDDWDRILDLIEALNAGGDPTISDAVGVFGAYQAIAQDADEHCDLELETPGL